MNLTKRRIIKEAAYPICTRLPETVVHVIWDSDAAQDVWARILKLLQKGIHGMTDLFQLLENLMEWLAVEDLELVLVQGWLIWNQQNRVLHGGKFHEPSWLSKRAVDQV